MLLGKKSQDGISLREETGKVAEALLANEYLPVETVGEMPSADYFETNYDVSEDGTRLLQSFFVPPRAPRTFSKLKLKMVLAQAGLLQQFLSVLQGVELIEGSGYMASDAFADAVNLSESNDGFKAAVKAAKNALGVTDEDVERILAASVAD